MFDGVDDGVGGLFAKGWAAPAASCTAVLADEALAHIPGTMHHNVALSCEMVDALFQSIEPQGVAIAAVVGLSCAKEPKTRLQAIGPIRKATGPFAPRILPM